jgi:putative ABC transport system permease protein
MKMLLKKSLRSLRSALGQYLALAAVVAGGVAVYYGANTTLAGLIASRDAVYRESRFADHYFDVLSAPRSLAITLQAVPGILEVAPRISLNVRIVRNSAAQEAGRLISCEDQPDVGINRVRVLKGRRSERNGSIEPEAMIDHQYASAHGMRPGDAIEVLAKGRHYRLKIVGIFTSPEFLHKKKSSLEFPGWGGLGIILTDLTTVQNIFGSPGEVNQFLVRMVPGGKVFETTERIANILYRYGLKGDYSLEDHPSHRYIRSQIQTLGMVVALLPPWLFIAALLMQALLLRRMIWGGRRQIGVFKALGYASRSIVLTYTIPPLIIGLLGSAVGLFCGYGLTVFLSTLLERAIDLPVEGWAINLPIMLKTVLISMATPLSAGILSSREIARIDPAAAFRIELPPVQKQTAIERILPFWKALPGSWKMSLRSISRNPGRFVSMTLGIVICLAMLLVTIRFSDSRNTMLERHFQDENRYDYLVKLSSLFPKSSVAYWARWPEVRGMECSLEIPVKLFRRDSTGIDPYARNEVLVGLEPSGKLQKVYDQNRKVLEIPNDGLILNSIAADELRLSTGDYVVVEIKEGMGAIRRSTLLVRAVSELNIGRHSIVSISQASEILGGRNLVNAVMLRGVEPDFRALEERLVRIPKISAILSQQEQYQNAAKLTEAITWFSSAMTVFALVIGGAIVYKNSLMAYFERIREIATLQVLGWTNREIAAMLLNDVILAFAVGLVIGIPVSIKTGSYYLRAISSETFLWPIVLYPGVCLISIAATGLFALAGHLLAVRRVQKLDPLAAIKSQE